MKGFEDFSEPEAIIDSRFNCLWRMKWMHKVKGTIYFLFQEPERRVK